MWSPAQKQLQGQFHLNSRPASDNEQPDRELLQEVNKFLLEKDWRHTGWWQGQGQTEFGRLLTTPGPLWPFLLLLSSHTRLSPKSSQQLRQKTDFIPVLRRERTTRPLGEAAWPWKQTHPTILRMQSSCLQLPHKHHFPGTTGAAVPSPWAGRGSLVLGILGAGWCPPPQGQAQPVSTTSTALVPVWNWLHVLLWSQRRAQETPTRAKERCPQSVCAFQTPELWCYLASETFKVLARRKPAPTAEESVLHKAAFP